MMSAYNWSYQGIAHLGNVNPLNTNAGDVKNKATSTTNSILLEIAESIIPIPIHAKAIKVYKMKKLKSVCGFPKSNTGNTMNAIHKKRTHAMHR